MANIVVIDKDKPFKDGSLDFNLTQGIPAVRQTILTRVQTFKTEFFMDVSYGVDWYNTVLNSGVQVIEQEAELNDVARATNGVQSLQASEILKNVSTRESVYLARVISDGQIVDFMVPFDFLEIQ